jgi:hypothetical protein
MLPASPRARLGLLAGGLAAIVFVTGLVTLVRGGDSSPAVQRVPGVVSQGGDFPLAAYEGLGAWVDVFDFVPAYQNGGVPPTVVAADVDTMASLGVKTLYLQAARNDERTNGPVAPDLLVPFLERAHRHGMRVVGWYYPDFASVDTDLERLLQIAHFDVGGQRFDGVSVDIEDNQVVADPAERSRRLVDLSRRLREALGPDATISATVLPAVLTEVLNPTYWAGFPWAELKPYYDVWMPMAYWSFRDAGSPYKSGYTYTVESVRRMRALVGDPNLKVHPVGGIADLITETETRDFLRALTDTDSLGGSLYDYRTTNGGIWGVLRGTEAALAAAPSPTTTQPDATTIAPAPSG